MNGDIDASASNEYKSRYMVELELAKMRIVQIEKEIELEKLRQASRECSDRKKSPCKPSTSHTLAVSPSDEFARALSKFLDMPKREIIKFDGNPANYWNFIKNFEDLVDNEAIGYRIKEQSDMANTRYGLLINGYSTGKNDKEFSTPTKKNSGSKHRVFITRLSETNVEKPNNDPKNESRLFVPSCILCLGSDFLEQCLEFIDKDLDERLAFVSKRKLCNTMFEQFYKNEFDAMSGQVPRPVEDRKALSIMLEFKQLVDRYYQIALPWRRQHILPNNRKLVMNRLNSLRKRLCQDSDLHKEYTNVMSQYIEGGFAKMVEEDHVNGQVWHLPHRHGFALVIYCMVYLYRLRSIFRPAACYFTSVSLLRTSKQPVLPRIMDFYVDVPSPVHCLDVIDAFRSLSKSEKDYVFSSSQASWVGGLIGLIQASPESAGIFLFIYRFRSRDIYSFTEEAKRNFSKEEINHLLSYLASVLDDFGSYLSFEATKFVPAITLSRVTELLSVNSAFSNPETSLKASLGFGTTEIITYYSVNCTHSDTELIQRYVESIKTEPCNTQPFKNADSKTKVYSLWSASAEKSVQPIFYDGLPSDTSLHLEYGDYSELMKLLVDCCKNSKAHSLNQIESEMWHQYAESFTTSSVVTHKEASRLWVKDKNPVVENYTGFIESYRDPFGVHAKFESFVAVPDFISLDVVTFKISGNPVETNIPNYGFKNVSLDNVLSARFTDPKSEFLRNEDKQIYVKHAESSFELQVGLYELLGNGSGKLFWDDCYGKRNFHTKTTEDIIHGDPVKVDKCRAECVGIYLSDLPLALEQFGLNIHCAQGDVPDVVYVNWLSVFSAVATFMEFYSPAENPDDNGSWCQARCYACYATLWLREYLPMLQARSKWLDVKRNLQPGDLVLVNSTDTERFLAKAIVKQVYYDQDGRDRTVRLKTATQEVERDKKRMFVGRSRQFEGSRYDKSTW
ncbi:unnamed protein product [Trichobilharzia regenti]|nr:unnamed protein product [Trichobilharzia regenti]